MELHWSAQDIVFVDDCHRVQHFREFRRQGWFAMALSLPTHNTESETTCTSDPNRYPIGDSHRDFKVFQDYVCQFAFMKFHRILPLACVTFFTHVKGGPHTIVHEHAPHSFVHEKKSPTCSYLPKFGASFWIMWSVMSFASLLCVWKTIDGSSRNFGAGVNLTRGFTVLWALVSASSRVRGFQDELDELWRVFLCCDEVECIRFHQAVPRVGFLSQSSFLIVFGEECGRTGFPKAALLGSSLRYDRLLLSLLIHPFLWRDKVHGVGFDFAETCSSGISLGLFEIPFAERRSNKKWLLESVRCYIKSNTCVNWVNALAKTKPWLTRQLVFTYLVWMVWSRLVWSNNQSRSTLWVLETCLILGTPSWLQR